MSGEADERLAAGPRGAKGEQGERGARGLSRIQGRAVVVLFVIGVLAGVGNLLWTAHETNVNRAQFHAQQVAQQKAAAAVLGKLCTSFARQAALKPPLGNPADNPARAYDQGEHAILAQLGPDIGCGKAR